MFVQWLLRLIGYGIAGGASFVATKYGPEWGSCVGLVGGAILNKASNTFIPRKGQPGS